MVLGGALLAAGMELAIRPQDHNLSGGTIHLVLHRIVTVDILHGAPWALLDGSQMPTASTTWRACRIHVRVDALKRSLVIL
jgi:hypothetical protein